MTNNTDPVRAHDELRVQAALLRTPEFMAQFDPEKFAGQLERIADALAQQPAAVDEAGAWAKQQPTCPGIYGICGFNLCRPVSEQFEAVVVVREYGGELVCNLHESTSEDDLESWAPICDLDPDFEWRAFVPGWEQRGGRAIAAQQQGGRADGFAANRQEGE